MAFNNILRYVSSRNLKVFTLDISCLAQSHTFPVTRVSLTAPVHLYELEAKGQGSPAVLSRFIPVYETMMLAGEGAGGLVQKAKLTIAQALRAI